MNRSNAQTFGRSQYLAGDTLPSMPKATKGEGKRMTEWLAKRGLPSGNWKRNKIRLLPPEPHL